MRRADMFQPSGVLRFFFCNPKAPNLTASSNKCYKKVRTTECTLIPLTEYYYTIWAAVYEFISRVFFLLSIFLAI